MNPTNPIVLTLCIVFACTPVLLGALCLLGALRPEPVTRKRKRMSPADVERTLVLADLRRQMHHA